MDIPKDVFILVTMCAGVGAYALGYLVGYRKGYKQGTRTGVFVRDLSNLGRR